MTFSDYLLNGILVGLVILQMRGRRLTHRALLLPLGIVTWAAVHYLNGIPTAGNDLVLVIGGALIGAALGTGAACFTRIERRDDGPAIAKATVVAAGLWIAGVGSRIAFSLFAQHGGGPALERFSAAHDITSINAWVAGLILMALAEVISRTVILGLRSGELQKLASGVAGRYATRIDATA